MATTPRLPRKGDLKAINSYLSDITTKLDKIGSVEAVFGKIDPTPYRDISRDIENIARLNKSWADTLERIHYKNKDLRGELDKLAKKEEEIRKKRAKDMENLIKFKKEHEELKDKIKEIGKELDKNSSRYKTIGKLLGGSILSGIDKIGKTVTKLGLEGLTGLFAGLEVGITNAYELFERWTKALGQFKTQTGAASKNMDQLTAAASQVEGVFYGLTGEFGQGIAAMGEFVEGLGRVEDVSKGGNIKRLAVDATLASRALGISAGEAGSLARSFQQLGDGRTKINAFMADIIRSSRAAGVSTGHFAREIADSRDFLTSFGKEGRKVFLDSAAFAARLGVSLKSLEQFTDLTDTFESTAQAAAKLNTVFGTSIDSLQLLMENDPSKRLEMVRQALQGQGKTYDNLNRQERKFLAQTLQLSQEELAGVLNTGQTLEEFQKKQAKARDRQVNDEKLIRRALAQTATTLFSFGQAWDMLTVKIFKLIKPFTDAIGLTEKGKEGFTGFGQAMSTIFTKVGSVIDDLSKNKGLHDLFEQMGSDVKEFLIKGMKYLTSPEFREDVDSVVKGMRGLWTEIKAVADIITDKLLPAAEPVLRTLAEHVDKIAAGWTIFKAGLAAVSGAKGIMSLAKILGFGGGAGGGTAAAGEIAAPAAAGGGGAGLGGTLAAGGAGGAAFGGVVAAGLVPIIHSQMKMNDQIDKLHEQYLQQSESVLKGDIVAAMKQGLTFNEAMSGLQKKLDYAVDQQFQSFEGISLKTGRIFEALDAVAQMADQIQTEATGQTPGQIKKIHFGGGASAGGGGGTGGPGSVQVVAGDVYLDKEKVGKHIARTVQKENARENLTIPSTY